MQPAGGRALFGCVRPSSSIASFADVGGEAGSPSVSSSVAPFPWEWSVA